MTRTGQESFSDPDKTMSETVLAVYWTVSMLKDTVPLPYKDKHGGWHELHRGGVKNTNTFEKNNNRSLLAQLLNILLNTSNISEQNVWCRCITQEY